VVTPAGPRPLLAPRGRDGGEDQRAGKGERHRVARADADQAEGWRAPEMDFPPHPPLRHRAIRHECRDHAVPATWTRHPCRMKRRPGRYQEVTAAHRRLRSTMDTAPVVGCPVHDQEKLSALGKTGDFRCAGSRRGASGASGQPSARSSPNAGGWGTRAVRPVSAGLKEAAFPGVSHRLASGAGGGEPASGLLSTYLIS
jgi:hypothetical protein